MNLDNVIAVRDTKKVYKDGNKTIKLFVEEYSKPNILNEALNLARVESVGLNIPKLLEVTSIDNKWGIVTEYVEGKNLETLMNENPEKKEEYMKLFVELQLEILSKEAPSMLNKLKEKMKRKIGEAKLDDTIKYELNTRLESMPEERRLCHGDFNPTNVIIRDDGKAFIIDWAHVTAGNSEADAARTYLVFCINGKMEEAKKYLDMFSEKSGIDKKAIQRWIPIVAASQLSKGNEKEREFLMHWIDVIEY